MSDRYDPSRIEPKWQAWWEARGTFRTPEDPSLPKKYILDMFPYPSGAGLHVGHPEGYTATDIVCRYLRARGFAVLHPMGWDAFGLPAEQYAIQTGTHPAVTTRANIATFKRQIQSLGLSYDWEREVDTTDPAYFKWTQWIFLQLFRRGLAYQSEIPVNWCPALGTVLANEEVVDGKSERGGHPVLRMPLRQWMLKITAYADRLLDDLDLVKWPDSTKTMQEEWIGRSEGAEVKFALEDGSGALEVFTTRPDTLFGATFMVVAPEHPFVERHTTHAQKAAVEAYVHQAIHRSDLDRKAAKEKTGVFTGGFVVNPVNGERVPVWVADYVLMGYGTGAIMAVPAHDERDFEFARAFGISVVQVVSPDGRPRSGELEAATTEEGLAVNSGPYDGLPTAEFKRRITADLEAAGRGRKRIEYRLRDWVFSRQRYWGEPIPIYFPVETDGDPRAGAPHTIRYDLPMAVDEAELPLLLPDLEDFSPGDDPAGALARAVDWRFFRRDGQWYARETNTMPQWAGSCWYYLRFMDPGNPDAAWSKEAAARWLPVDLYVGGAEHAVLHLLYARFWHKVLHDAGFVSCPEPFARLVHQGMILGEVEYTAYKSSEGFVSREWVVALPDGGYRHRSGGQELTPVRVPEEAVEKRGANTILKADPEIVVEARAFKMSKSRGNVINPDDVVRRHGADALRLYEMFLGPLEAVKPWSTSGIQGVARFLERSFALASRPMKDGMPEGPLLRLVHKTIRKVTEDIEGLRFNTAISALMVLLNELSKTDPLPKGAAELHVRLMHPFAPHLAEELWERLGHPPSLQEVPWPGFDPDLCQDESVTVAVQVNGKMRGTVQLAAGSDQDTALGEARKLDTVQRQLEGKDIRKVIWVADKLLNLIAG
ncbi:MAG: leucine--tRNA ligase [Acidobacteria bacterium]|nr:leucine--tRNA ligase [Acidobacteriota bacterium]